jgi:putative transposase
VNKQYQTTPAGASAVGLAVPETVTIAMAEVAADMREGLLALAVGAGLQVMQMMFDRDVNGWCGPRGKHNPGRAGHRHGTEAGSVTLGGRRVPVVRPRVRAVDGSGELPVVSYELFEAPQV